MDSEEVEPELKETEARSDRGGGRKKTEVYRGREKGG